MINQILPFLRHWLGAETRYGVHSPFVYHFVTQILPHQSSEAGKRIDSLRKEQGQRKGSLEIRDFGAGYRGKSIPVIEKSYAQVVRGSARKRRNGEFLRRLFAHYAPNSALELGTNLGFSTAYQLAGHPVCKMYSLEGSPALAEEARRNLNQLGYQAEIRVGEFGETLPQLLQEGINLDAVLLDGNHRYAPTVKYFEQVEAQLSPGAMVIVDDINWSRGMRQAWTEIAQRESVSVSIDLYWMGICFVKREQRKQHFRFRTCL